MENTSDNVYAFGGSSSIEYGLDEAAVSIDDMIEALQTAKEDGATHVVYSSGNYRGAKYARPSTEFDLIYPGDEL